MEIEIYPGTHKDFTDTDARQMVGGRTSDGWTIKDARLSGPRVICLTVEKE